jgi:predicted nucleotidyltransferase component of viral defense system
MQRLMIRFAMERFMFRLSVSKYRNNFILKGAMLLGIYVPNAVRTTKDVDFLVFGEFTPESVKRMLAEVCAIPQDDGLTFDAAGIKVVETGNDRPYPGFQASVPAYLGSARSSFGLDIAFGEAVTPAPPRIKFPTMLGFPEPELRVYPLPTVVAEKFQAMVYLGLGNKRMKDYYDLWTIAQNCELYGAELQAAIKATFERRSTAIPAVTPQGLGETFYNAKRQKQEWREFLQTYSLRKSLSFEEICLRVQDLVMPVAEACVNGVDFNAVWRPSAWHGPE